MGYINRVVIPEVYNTADRGGVACTLRASSVVREHTSQSGNHKDPTYRKQSQWPHKSR